MQELYEKLKLFYLGFKENSTTPVVYENKDLTTHALIIGMTGSGKTGLGVGLIEEATLDNIPSIIIDPKGDMGNLLLTFPKMDAQSFKPWIDADQLNGQSIDAYAQKTASMWKQGIQNSTQDLSRVQRLKDSGDFTIYTPGSSAGVGVALLSDFKAPPQEIMEDRELLSTLVSSTVTSILDLIDIKSDPISGKEHVLISSIFMNFYAQHKDFDIQTLISSIVSPPFKKIGVFAIESFMSQDKRLELALKLNTIIANPSFSGWMQGEALDMDRMLFTKDGKAKVNIFTISHLSDKERMFFVTLLLNTFLGWMRRQEGSARLRALFYMDEIFGFFPPTANPPSKQPMITMLKLARAFGVGVVLSTQNPIDLDYKGLSNIGTWFIGRLQTSQDKDRVIDGLQVQGSKYSKKELFELLSNIKKRHFLLKNIHDDGLIVFATRWVLSYLKGPLSKKQISALMKDKKLTASIDTPKIKKDTQNSERKPILNDNISQHYSYYSQSDEYILAPFLACEATVNFVDKRRNVQCKKEICVKIPLHPNSRSIKWQDIQQREDVTLEQSPRPKSKFAHLPNFLLPLKSLNAYKKEFKNYLYQNQKESIFENKKLKIFSSFNTPKEAFMLKVHDKLEALSDEKAKKIKDDFIKKQEILERKLQSANYKLEKEKGDVSAKTTNTIINVGTSILGAFLGGNLFSRTNASRLGSSVRSASGIVKEKRDVSRVEDIIENINDDMEELREKLSIKLDEIKEQFSVENYPTQTVQISPRRADIYDTKLFILWEEE